MLSKRTDGFMKRLAQIGCDGLECYNFAKADYYRYFTIADTMKGPVMLVLCNETAM